MADQNVVLNTIPKSHNSNLTNFVLPRFSVVDRTFKSLRGDVDCTIPTCIEGTHYLNGQSWLEFILDD